MSAVRVVKGAAAFGVTLGLGADDELVYDARYEPSEGVIARIREHEPAIVALLKARRTAAAIRWDALNDLSAADYEAMQHSVADEIEALQASLDKLGRAAAAILPTMKERACTWGAAVEALLEAPYNAKHHRRRPKFYSDAEWLAALHSARLLGVTPGLTFRRVTP